MLYALAAGGVLPLLLDQPIVAAKGLVNFAAALLPAAEQTLVDVQVEVSPKLKKRNRQVNTTLKPKLRPFPLTAGRPRRPNSRPKARVRHVLATFLGIVE